MRPAFRVASSQGRTEAVPSLRARMREDHVISEAKYGNQFSNLRDGLLSPEELAHNLGLSPATLADWRSEKRGPAYLKVGRRIWYPKQHVHSWLAEQLQETSNVTEESQREMELPLQAGRQGIQRYNRLGRHKTKHEGGSRPGVGTSSRTAGRPKAVTTDPGPGVQ